MVGSVFLATKSVSKAHRFRKPILKLIFIGEKYVQSLYTSVTIRKIHLNTPQATKTSRFIDPRFILGSVLLFKLPLYESYNNETLRAAREIYVNCVQFVAESWISRPNSIISKFHEKSRFYEIVGHEAGWLDQLFSPPNPCPKLIASENQSLT